MSHDQEHRTDPEAGKVGYLRGNDYALPYISTFSRDLGYEEDREMLQHVNCCFLSTPGVPPTLLALKQHAQSLAYLIALLEPDGHEAGARRGDGRQHPFDWLDNMAAPYANDHPDHHRQLTALLNEVKAHHDVLGTSYRCPLEDYPSSGGLVPRRPYASHHNLLLHANTCLERLDHEYSSTGGLLSVIPPDAGNDEETDELRAARNSLVGQLLTHMQRLSVRMRELELAYANALDALAGEAVVPMQQLGAAGPRARAEGRPVAYPQDRWVLANAGDDVLRRLHDLLDRREAGKQEGDDAARAEGLVSENLVQEGGNGDGESVRGIVYVDVTTRFYRLRGQGRGATVFVCPAWGEHPATEATRELEAHPGVMAVPMLAVAPIAAPAAGANNNPNNPPVVRASELERRYNESLERTARIERENERLRAEAGERDATVRALRRELARKDRLNGLLQDHAGGSGGGAERNQLLEELAAAKQDEEVALKEAGALRDRLAVLEGYEF